MNKLKIFQLLSISYIPFTALSTGFLDTTITNSQQTSFTDSPTQSLEKDTNNINPVYSYINARTFTIGVRYGSGAASFGTMWLFYHGTGDNFYGMSNLHVTSPMEDAKQFDSNHKYFYGYQTDSDINRWQNIPLNLPLTISSTSKNNDLCDMTDSYTDLFRLSINHKFLDMDVVKINFAKAAAEDPILKDRLDALKSHKDENYLVNFSSNKNALAPSDTGFYSGGYPLETSDGTSLQGDFGFTYHDDGGLPIRKRENSSAKEGGSIGFLYDENRVKYNLTGSNYCSQQYPSYRCGGGASGSMLLYASKPNDQSTYQVPAIYWGGWGTASYIQPYFSNFSLDWKKDKGFVDYFMTESHNKGDKVTSYDYKNKMPPLMIALITTGTIGIVVLAGVGAFYYFKRRK